MWRFSSLFAAMAAAILAAGCGGGGDDGAVNPLPSPYVNISAANQDEVARVSISSIESFIALPVIGESASPGLAKTAKAGTTSPVGRQGGLTHLALRALDFGGKQATAAGMARPLAQLPPRVVPCSVSGNQTYIVDDKDNSKTLTVGDTVSVSFSQCDDGDGTVNGSMALTIETYSGTPTTPLDVTGSAIFQSLTIDNDLFSYSVNGGAAFRVAYTMKTDGQELFASFTVASGGMTGVKKAMVAGGLSDSFTYHAGFTVSDRDFMSTAQGGTSSEIITASGDFASQSLGGELTLSTMTPFRSEYTDPTGDIFPTDGQLIATGRNNTKLGLAATETVYVRMDMCDDGDDTWEASKMVPWYWLFQ